MTGVAIARALTNPFRGRVRASVLTLGVVGTVVGVADAGSLMVELGDFRAELVSDPEKPRTAQPTSYRFRLSGHDGSPVTGAKVTLQGRMADGMTVVAPFQAAPEPGIYRGRVLFTMEGRWDLTLRVSGKGKPFELTLTEDVKR